MKILKVDIKDYLQNKFIERNPWGIPSSVEEEERRNQP